MILTKGNINEINFDAFLVNKILSGNLDSLLIVVPTNRKLRDLKKKIIDYFRAEPVSKINIETLTTLSSKLLMQQKGFIPLSEAASTVLIKESTEELNLDYFGSYSKGIPFGTLDRIKNVITEYKRHGITPSDIISESEILSAGEKAKAHDISRIYELYSEKCKGLRAYEIGDIYTSLIGLEIDDMRKYFGILYENVETVALNGFDEFTSIEIKLLNFIGECVDNEILVNIDYYGKNKEIFSHLDDTHSKLIDNGFRRIKDITPEEKSKFRDRIRFGLFNLANRETDETFRERIFKISAKNRVHEVEEIARIIKLKIIKENIEPQNVCVAFNAIGKYAGLIRDLFGKFGIPLNLTDRITVKSSPPVIAAVSLIDLITGDFYFRDILRVLTNRFLTFENINLSSIQFTASKLKILRGVDNWDFSVNDAIRLLEFDNELTEDEKSLLKETYTRAKQDVLKIAKLLQPLNKRNSKDEFISSFKKIILDLKLPQNVLNSSYGREEEFVKSLTLFLNSLEEVLNLVDSKDVLKEYPPHYFLDTVRTITNWARFNVKEKSDQGVLVTSVNEIRGLKFDILFLGGMVDGDFPTKYSPEIFFSDSFQKREYFHQTKERYHFYQSLCCWEKQLFLSVPKNDSKAELVESTFIKDFSQTVAITEYKEKPFAILSKEELLFNYSPLFNGKVNQTLSKWGWDVDTVNKNMEVSSDRKKNPFSDEPYSGFIGGGDDQIKLFLLEHSKKQFSITQLETYAKCPFKYFSERVLKLKSEEEPKEEVEPFELGNLLHSILYEFYRKVSSEKWKIGPPGTDEFNQLEGILFNIAEDMLNKLNLNSPLTFFEREKIMGIEGIKENSILYKFLELESKREDGFTPLLFEQFFGTPKIDVQKENVSALQIDDIQLIGKIDRIDADIDRRLFNIIDYKLHGKKPTLKDLKDGLSLQLPVYLKAGEKILKQLLNEHFTGFGMIIYSLDFRQDNFGPIPIKLSRKKLDDEDIILMNNQQIYSAINNIINYHNSIKRGKFNLSELDNREEIVCRYCDFSSLCRLKEVFE